MLFGKECRKILRSLTYIIYCFIVVLFFITQYFSDCNEREYPPVKNGDYGYKISEDHDLIMGSAVNSLISDYLGNSYVCYPLGFYKLVHLKKHDRAVVEGYIKEITGLDKDGLENVKNNSQKYYLSSGLSENVEYDVPEIPVVPTMTYERFSEIMADIDDILGGGSEYAEESLVHNFSQVPMTYEDALAEYEEIFEKDRISGAYARLFCDYTGIVLGIMPVFVAVALISADRRRKVSDLVYTRKISSFKLVFTRYAALVTTMFIPVLLSMTAAALQLMKNYSGENYNLSGMFTLPVFWLLPELMIVTAAGMLITEMFSGGTAIIVQFAWWFYDVISSGMQLDGKIGKFTLVCRHNTLYNRTAFLLSWDNFIFNRLFYFAAAIAAAALTAIVYELKRGGRFNGIRLFGEGGLLRRKA